MRKIGRKENPKRNLGNGGGRRFLLAVWYVANKDIIKNTVIGAANVGGFGEGLETPPI